MKLSEGKILTERTKIILSGRLIKKVTSVMLSAMLTVSLIQTSVLAAEDVDYPVTVTDEDGLYLESIVEYGNAVNITGQPTYAMALAYWNDVEYFTGVLGKLSKNLPTKLTTNYYVEEILEETTVYNISYSYNDNDDVAEEYFDNDENDFWINHIGQWVNHYEVYYGYRK